jgi:ubiquitin-conjugating enzyme E2 Z
MLSSKKRLSREISTIGDLSGQGIYYNPDDATMNKGNALILGPADSAYPHCLFFFRFEFPDDYPFAPPKVTFLSSDGKTRFHPNLYTEGKVCLSILGTYTGPSWQSTMSFSMILLSLKALLDSNPLTHEPGYEKYTLDYPKALHYAQYVKAKMVELTMNELKTKRLLSMFEEDLGVVLPELKKNLYSVIRDQAQYAETQYAHLPYGMVGSTQWKKLLSLTVE